MKLRDLHEKRISTPDVPVRKTVGKYFSISCYLEDRGWEYLDSGSFGSVYTHRDYPDFVLKVFRDPAYAKFLSFTNKSNNPHFPRVGRTFPIKHKNRIYHAVMIEKLNSSSGSWDFFYEDYFNEGVWLYSKLERKKRFADHPQYLEIDKKFPKYAEACQLIAQLVSDNTRRFSPDKSRMDTDIKANNILYRGKVPVFIDPVWDKAT